MDHRRLHLLEKVQVQLAAVAALVVVYFLLWPLLRPSDPHSPVAFVPTGSYGDAAMFAAAVWVLAGACALMTISARPEGALLASLIGAGGMSLRSAAVRPLLWRDLGSLHGQFIADMLILLAVVLVALAVVALVRWAISWVRPQWLWRSPIAGLTEDERKGRAEAARDGGGRRAFLRVLASVFAPGLARSGGLGGPGRDVSGSGTSPARRKASASKLCLSSLGCAALAAVIAVAVVLLLMRSAQRGQILFAVFVGFFLALFVSHQAFPTSLTPVAWAVPMLVGIGFYVLAAFTVGGPASSYSGGGGAGPGAWADVPFYAQVLPVDWLTAGAGGGLLGYWLSCRVQELRHIEGRELGSARPGRERKQQA
jgi:hypothetical protein